MSRKVARFTLAIMTTLLLLVVFWQFRDAIIYVLISLTLTAVMRPLSTRLIGRRLIWRILWVILYIVAIAGCVYLFFLSIRFAINEVQQLIDNLATQDMWILPAWLEGSAIQQSLLNWLPAPSEIFRAFTGEQGQLILPTLFGFLKNVGGIITAFIIILILSIYWGINRIHFERLWLSLLSSDLRAKARGIWRNIETEVGAYVRNQLLQSLSVGVLLGLGYWLLGSPYPVFMAVAGSIAILIPVIGAPLALIPPLVVGLLTSTQLSLFTSLYALIILIILIVWVKPRIFKRKWDNQLPTIILLLVLYDGLGVIGILIAPPISAICQILWSRLVTRRLPSGASAQISDLKERQEHLQEKVTGMGEESLPLITSSMDKLSELITSAEPLLKGITSVEGAVTD